MDQSTNKSFLDTLPPKTAFTAGFITAILCLGTLGFIILGGCLLSNSCRVSSTRVTEANAPLAAAPSAPSAAQAPSGPIPAVTDDDHIRGDKNAEVTIIEYSDFQCPFCDRFHPTMQQVMNDYQGRVRWVLRSYPLPFHEHAEPAANAAECASEQGKFWEFGDQLFANQATLGPDLYKKLATDLKLNMTKFNDCVSTGKYLNKIRAEAQAGGAAGVGGTPGSFVIDKNGQAAEIQGAQPYEVVKQAIDAALAS